jgi:hypothetical protein
MSAIILVDASLLVTHLGGAMNFMMKGAKAPCRSVAAVAIGLILSSGPAFAQGAPKPVAAAARAASPVAKRLVTLVKPHEREVQSLRLMLTMSPMPMPKTVSDCTVKKATPALVDYFAVLYTTHLSASELQQAVDFFEGKAGQAAVTIRLRYEQDTFDAVAKGKQVTDDKPKYPPEIQKALDAFGATPAGKNFVGDELAHRKPIVAETSNLSSAVMAECMADPAGGAVKR